MREMTVRIYRSRRQILHTNKQIHGAVEPHKHQQLYEIYIIIFYHLEKRIAIHIDQQSINKQMNY